MGKSITPGRAARGAKGRRTSPTSKRVESPSQKRSRPRKNHAVGVTHVIRDGVFYELHGQRAGGYFITVPALPGCTSFGETMDEALTMVREAMSLWVEFSLEQGLDVPEEFRLRRAS